MAVATDGQRLAPGIRIAPEDAHLVVLPGGRLTLDRHTPVSGHRPSGDVLLTSMAEALGRLATGVVLTGMGRDGPRGLGRIARAGGLTVAQDEATSAVYGMPRAAAEAGAEVVLPLGDVAALVRRECGLELPKSRPAALRAAIRRTGADDAGEFLALVGRRGSRAAVERQLDEVTVQETSFYRDVDQLSTIDWRGLHAAAVEAGASTLRVWSAGCATGEEAYSLAMLAIEAFAPEPPPVEVLGSDVSAAAIDRAREGRYRRRRARAVPPVELDRYLAADGHLLTVRPAVRALVRFSRHNLVRDGMPPAGEGLFDLVVCRNVLIYFEAETAEAVVRGLSAALRPGGLLLLGAADQLGRAVRAGLGRPRRSCSPVPPPPPMPAIRPARSRRSTSSTPTIRSTPAATSCAA